MIHGSKQEIPGDHKPMCLIEIEGITGGGKTTLIGYLQSHLKNLGYSVFCTKEPGFTDLGLDIRDILINKHQNSLSKITQMLLFLANRDDIQKKHLTESQYDFVLFDRYYGSTVVYQILMADPIVRKNYRSLLDRAMKLITGRDWPIDMTILLDIDPKIALDRIKARKKTEFRSINEANNNEIFLNYNTTLRNCFKQYLFESSKTNQRVLIDANGSIENTVKLACNSLSSSLCNL